jgi:hypothetical protein
MLGHELYNLDTVLFDLLNSDSSLSALLGAVNQVYTVDVGTSTAGTFTLTQGGLTTTTIAFNASAATVQTDLNLDLGAGSVTVTGPDGGPWVITFVGNNLNNQPVLMTGDGSGLVGGVLTVTQTQLGVSRVFSEAAPQFTLGPFVVFNFQSNTDITAIGAVRIATRPLVNIKSITQENTWKNAYLIAKRVDELVMGSKIRLNASSILDQDLQIDCCGREQMYRFRELDQGLRWNYLGSLFRFFISAATA